MRPHLGLDRASLLFAASHTHTAPAADPRKPRLGTCDPDLAAEVLGHIGPEPRGDRPVLRGHGPSDAPILRRVASTCRASVLLDSR